MNNINSVSKGKCTGCGACSIKCPKQCIEMANDDTDNIYPKVNIDECINCGMCIKVCHAVETAPMNRANKAFAGWSMNEKERKNGASGGIASAIYRYANSNNWLYVGVRFDEHWNLYYDIDNNLYKEYSNSKYVYGNMSNILNTIKEKLENINTKLIVIGLPCQISSMKKYIGDKYNDKLLTVDLVCHGVCSNEYLKQHIKSIEEIKKQKTTKVFFRNPKFNTGSFQFTLQNDKSDIFYNKNPKEDDYYQIGYHNAIIYRENCYNCKYASINRVSDLTLADYWGIGSEIPFEYDKNNVSLILSNTENGEKLLNRMKESNYIYLVERPIEESLKTQSQLNRPSKATKLHYKFMKKYKKNKNFEKSAKSVMHIDVICNKIGAGRYLRLYRRFTNKILNKF